MKWMLDTSACIAAMKGNSGVLEKLQSFSPHDLGVSMITVYELWSGIELCKSPEKEAPKVEAFLLPLHVLPFDQRSARVAARVRADLQRKGTPIGPYDVLIAGHALSLEVGLVSGNISEFQRVTDLLVENWVC